MYWTDSNMRIELDITMDDASSCSGQGAQDENVQALSETPRIAKQLAKVGPIVLRTHLLEYGAWDDDDLRVHEDNLQRLLWLACCDISEGNI